MSLERRFTPTECRAIGGDDGKKGGGYAAVFYNGTPGTEYKLWSGAVERILPGAFHRAVVEDDVAALFNHDPNHLLGRTTAGTLRLQEDSTGLAYDFDPPDTQTGRDVMVSLERRDLKGSSFAFEVTDEQWKKESGVRIREIRGVKLYDVGPVTFPAYAGTSAGVRSEADAAEARASLEAWEAAERKEVEKQQAALRAKHTQYQARARAVEVGK